jgi:GT2 family glycosyltransferase
MECCNYRKLPFLRNSSEILNNKKIMINIAVIMTVFNRKQITINGLNSLQTAINRLGKNYLFDIYMTDDGSTDGTSTAVSKLYPNVHILLGDGNLYWSGGMRKAWQTAIDRGIKYDYYLWFNDDAVLFDDALTTMFETVDKFGNNTIISGAFCDKNGNVSYGGKDKTGKWLSPNDNAQVHYMNGNLVLIPNNVYQILGNIDKIYVHGLGDWDYGLRAIENGLDVKISHKYVGVTDRHDADLVACWSNKFHLRERFKMFYGQKSHPSIQFVFYKRHFGLVNAIIKFIITHIYTLFPIVYRITHKSKQ